MDFTLNSFSLLIMFIHASPAAIIAKVELLFAQIGFHQSGMFCILIFTLIKLVFWGSLLQPVLFESLLFFHLSILKSVP